MRFYYFHCLVEQTDTNRKIKERKNEMQTHTQRHTHACLV